MKIEVNLTKKKFYALFVVAVFLAGILVVYAQFGVKPNPGHLTSELVAPTGCSAGQVLKVGTDGLITCGAAGAVTGILNVYNSVSSTISDTISGSWVELPELSITVVPSASNSKFLINANVIARNPQSSGSCFVGLFKGDTELIAPFAVSDQSWNGDSEQGSISYVDTAIDSSSRNYKIKVRKEGVMGSCVINRAPTTRLGQTHGVSTMSIVEIGSGGTGT